MLSVTLICSRVRFTYLFWACREGSGQTLTLKTLFVFFQEEFGHLVLLALFDCVDDTVLVKKIMFSVRFTLLYSILLSFVIKVSEAEILNPPKTKSLYEMSAGAKSNELFTILCKPFLNHGPK